MDQTLMTTAETDKTRRQTSAVVNFFRRLVKEKPLGTFSLVIILVLIVLAIFADLIAPYHYSETNIVDRLAAPSAKYILGTDSSGRDMFSRIIYGARLSLIVGLGATALSTVIATLIGVVTGYLGGKVDLVAQRFVDAWLAFPALIIFLLLMNLIGGGVVQLILVLGIGGGIGSSRRYRSLAFWIKESMYINASKSLGASNRRLIIRHMLPNIMPMIIVGFTMSIGNVILAEAGLSFLGFGIPPPFPSWGQMISGQSRRVMEKAPWVPLWPGIAISITIFSMNMFGDAMRDLLDPRLRGGIGGMGAFGSQNAERALRKWRAKAEKY